MSALTRLRNEAIQMAQNPPSNCTAGPIGDDMFKWQAVVMGPMDTPYEGGRFELFVTFPQDYPMKPPQVSFITKIYHPNVSAEGRICVDILSQQWSPVLSLAKVLLSICALLCEPNPHSALRSDIAEEMLEDRAKYEATAREWTRTHASGI